MEQEHAPRFIRSHTGGIRSYMAMLQIAVSGRSWDSSGVPGDGGVEVGEVAGRKGYMEQPRLRGTWNSWIWRWWL
jgi:hypothetical protein